MNHAIPQADVFGKPNVIINPQTIEYGEFLNLALKKFPPSELIELAEKYT